MLDAAGQEPVAFHCLEVGFARRGRNRNSAP